MYTYVYKSVALVDEKISLKRRASYLSIQININVYSWNTGYMWYYVFEQNEMQNARRGNTGADLTDVTVGFTRRKYK